MVVIGDWISVRSVVTFTCSIGMTIPSTPSVTFAYADGSANTVRPAAVTYPNLRVVTTGYGSAGTDGTGRAIDVRVGHSGCGSGIHTGR